jgi:hypothetical protein
MISSYMSYSSAFALYIEHFAYYCGFYFAPFRPSNSDFGYVLVGLFATSLSQMWFWDGFSQNLDWSWHVIKAWDFPSILDLGPGHALAKSRKSRHSEKMHVSLKVFMSYSLVRWMFKDVNDSLTQMNVCKEIARIVIENFALRHVRCIPAFTSLYYICHWL